MKEMVDTASTGTSTQFTHAFTANNALFSRRGAQQRYRSVAPSVSRYVVAGKVRKSVVELAVYIPNIGYPSHKRSNLGITRPITGNLTKVGVRRIFEKSSLPNTIQGDGTLQIAALALRRSDISR
jgi:hypothetical protein